MKKNTKSAGNKFRSADFFVTVILFSLAAICILLFRFDLNQTFISMNQEPIGTVVVRRNIVQRRLSDRVLWDRLANESPVYIGDLIRVAELSSATLIINNSSIEIDENTLIRISLAADGESVQITLSEGNLALSSGYGGGSFFLDISGHQIQTTEGTVLSAAAVAGGVVLEVSEGNVFFDMDGTVREIASGEVIALDAGGMEVEIRTAVVRSPSPNIRYLGNSNEPLPVDFTWNRINLLPEETLTLETAYDRGFSRIHSRTDGLDDSARVYFEPGNYNWRLSLYGNVLSEGRLTVADGAGPELQSPAISSIIRFTDEPPVINFQWADAEDAVSYILEISSFPDFINPEMRIQTDFPFFAVSALDEGRWYWRVRSIFPAVFRGSSSFSPISFFNIEQTASGIAEDTSLEEWLIAETPPDLLTPPPLNLISPVAGTSVPGLTALRQLINLTWELDAEIESSRFVLSSSSNPFDGEPLMQINNPPSTISLERLGEGVYYWNVEAVTRNGFTVSAQESGSFQVLAIPPLPAPQIIRPAAGFRFGIDELRASRSIDFNWQTVQGANAYIFSLYQQTAGGRRQVISPVELRVTAYTINNLRLLDRGTFIWRLEAISRGANNAIEQRGIAGEYTFILDFPSPTSVRIEDIGALYGN